MTKQSNIRTYIVAVIFLLAALWYFFPIAKDASLIFRMRLALPAAILALGGIGLLPRLISWGFVFCTIGDAMGVAGSFEGQMGGFAVAQICFIAQFVKDIRQGKVSRAGFVTASFVCLVPLLFAAWTIFPNVRPLPIRIGCVIYALLLLSSAWTSIIRAFSIKRYIAMIGCIIFLISDFTIAWNKFTEHIPHAGRYIMITYYSALILIFFGTLRRKTLK
ncbi:MAG: lysoplasmalogenase [Muribaculaceae bacterium]|nr:lysoplasmalogenase [Muribaculaceae bacterium]